MPLGKDILTARTTRLDSVRVDEWDGEVLLRPLSHIEVIEIQSLARKAVDDKTGTIRDTNALQKFNFRLIQMAWVDADGMQVLGVDDEELLLSQPNRVIDLLTRTIRDLNALSDDASKDAEKNS